MAKELSDFLTTEHIESVRAPIETARTLPNFAYLCPDFHELEIEKIFLRNWAAACFTFDVADIGDVFPMHYCGMPIVAVRDSGATVRVFHNVSPYDGCPLVLRPQSGLKKLVSPYHGWEYGLDGQLLAAPYWDGTVKGNLSALANKHADMVEIPCATFMNMIFINLSEQPSDFESHIAPIKRQFSEYALDNLEPGLDASGQPIITEHERKCNWKTFYENSALNVLHENFVHDLYMMSPEVPRIKEDGVATFQNIIDDGLLALGFDAADFEATYPAFNIPHIGSGTNAPSKECFGTHYPNFYLSVAPTHIEISAVLPDGPARVTERQAILYHPTVAVDPKFLKLRHMLAAIFDGASTEDGAICEAVQSARKSPVFDQKFYSPFWDQLHYRVNNMILDDLER